MKICPKCRTEYSDSVSFCIKDGCQLQENISEASKPVSKKYGCLKKILIAIVILILGVFWLYKHLMNAATYLRTEPGIINVSKSGGTGKVNIDYDGYVWMVNYKPDWVLIDENENSFEFTVEPNRSGQKREGAVTIKSGRLITNVVIRQAEFANLLRVSENNLHFNSSGGSENIEYDTDGCDLRYKSPDWINIKELGEGLLSVNCAKNSGEYRSCSMSLYEDQVKVTIFVSQGGECNVCHGKGEMICNSCYGLGNNGFGMYSYQCFFCGGTGKINCGACDGSGYIE